MALKMTIFEAKGLEFDDVLLYNFFSTSKVRNSLFFIMCHRFHSVRVFSC